MRLPLIWWVGGGCLQERVQVLPNETAEELWRRALAPLGLDLISAAVDAITRERTAKFGWTKIYDL